MCDGTADDHFHANHARSSRRYDQRFWNLVQGIKDVTVATDLRKNSP